MKIRNMCGWVALFVALAAACLALPTKAEAAARVSVSGTPSVEGTSTLTLSGSGFQSVQNGFGGIYVLFGVVDGTWQPSKGGKTGENYRYAYDDESNPEGYQVFVTFPGSSTAYAANGGELHPDGTWNASIKIPGAKFTSYDRAHNAIDVDCTKEQCGIITVGAHGVDNANNETFTPITFAAGAGAAGAGVAGDTSDASGGNAGDNSGQDAGQGDGAQGNGQGNGDGAGQNGQQQGQQTGQQQGGSNAQPGPATAPAAGPIPPLFSNEQINAMNSNALRLIVILLVGVVVTVCVIALSVGIGAYTATKALLIGVNPEALERVRTMREKRAIAAEHKRKRKAASYRAKQERKTRKHLQRVEARTARSEMESLARTTRMPSVSEASAPMRFFDIIDTSSAQTDRAQTNSAQTDSAQTDSAQTERTLVLDRVEEVTQ